MGEEGRPHGVGVRGRIAIGVKGGEGREERPVPPIMAMGIGSVSLLSSVGYSSLKKTIEEDLDRCLVVTFFWVRYIVNLKSLW